MVRVVGKRDYDSHDYIKEIGYDEFGQRVYIEYGNGVETRYIYDPKRRWLSQIETENSMGRRFQDIEYEFDKVGNILRFDNRASNVSQEYKYDDLYQLVEAEGRGPEKNKMSEYRQTFEYDSIGNILHKTSYNRITPGKKMPKELNYDFAYKYGGSKPHAPTQIGNWRYQYDSNGNITTVERVLDSEDSKDKKDKNNKGGSKNDKDVEGGGTSREYFWNEENRLTEAKVNGRSTYFLYNAEGERTVKRGQHGETLYVSKFYQLQNGQQNQVETIKLKSSELPWFTISLVF